MSKHCFLPKISYWQTAFGTNEMDLKRSWDRSNSSILVSLSIRVQWFKLICFTLSCRLQAMAMSSGMHIAGCSFSSCCRLLTIALRVQATSFTFTHIASVGDQCRGQDQQALPWTRCSWWCSILHSNLGCQQVPMDNRTGGRSGHRVLPANFQPTSSQMLSKGALLESLLLWKLDSRSLQIVCNIII